jgi:hypothetical protein
METAGVTNISKREGTVRTNVAVEGEERGILRCDT